MRNKPISHHPVGTTPPFRIRKDIVGRSHFRNLHTAPAGHARFIQFQRCLLEGAISFETPEASLAAHLIAFDGIATRLDLINALSNSRSIYRRGQSVYFDWKGDNGMLNRRILSGLTQKVWLRQAATPANTLNIITSLESALAALYPAPTLSKVDALLSDCQIYLLWALSGPLAAHCLTSNPLSALPRSALTRGDMKLSLTPPENTLAHRGSEIGFSMALDAYFSGSDQAGGDALIRELINSCKSSMSDADDVDKRKMLRRCLNLSPLSERSGQIAPLVLAWAIDLIESGTPHEKNLAPATIRLYVKYGAPVIYARFKNESIEELDSDSFADIYTGILANTTRAAKTTASALKSWHAFIQHWLDAAPLKVSLYRGIPPSIPKANVLWPHEITLIDEWIGLADGDERLQCQLRLSHQIATSIRIRISELLKLRIRNIRQYPDAVEIEISPLRRDGSLKTESSKRFIRVRNQGLANLLIEWLLRRKSEGAFMKDLLFGDPHNPESGYKLGQMYVTLNLLLKCATGDPSISFHSYSHSIISTSIRDALLGTSNSEINRLDQVAVDSGHASPQTSLLHYFHLFEEALRFQMDQAIHTIKLNSTLVAMHSNLSAAAFRKRRSRSKSESAKNVVAWQAINDLPFCLLVDNVSAPYTLEAPSPPMALFRSPEITYGKVFNLLSDLTNGLSIAAACSRSSIPEETVYKVAAISCGLLEELEITSKSYIPRKGAAAVADLQKIFLQPRSRQIQFARAKQSKFHPISQYLHRRTDELRTHDAVTSWIRCYSNGYLSLEVPATASGLIHFLKDANVPVGSLIIKCASTPAENDQKLRLHQIRQLVSSVFSIAPLFHLIHPKRGRPACYVCISGSTQKSPPSAATSNSGLNALLFTSAVFLRLETKQTANPKYGDHHG